MELWVFVVFAWFLFIVGKIIKDFAVTFISGALILMVGLLSFPMTPNISTHAFALVNLCLGIYILFRSIIELITLYLKDWKFKLKKRREKCR